MIQKYATERNIPSARSIKEQDLEAKLGTQQIISLLPQIRCSRFEAKIVTVISAGMKNA
jgi:hypothetical protein